MRIIAGKAKGRTLFAPKGDETRPTSDKIREALFSILQFDVPCAKVLDLFGGTGALALEAVSRGAREAVICDISQEAARAIAKNIKVVTDDGDNVRFMKLDYRKALESLRGEQFDLIFLDPPYRMHDAYEKSLQTIFESGMLAEDGIVIAEKQKGTVFALPEGALENSTRVYRDTQLDFIVRK